jgi:hypothetical protein
MDVGHVLFVGNDMQQQQQQRRPVRDVGRKRKQRLVVITLAILRFVRVAHLNVLVGVLFDAMGAQ